MYRRGVSGTICRDTLLLRWNCSLNLSHAYFYGKWRAKFPNILHNERTYRQSGGDPAGLRGSGGSVLSTKISGEGPIAWARIRILLRRRVAATFCTSPYTPVASLFRFRRGARRDSRSRGLHLRSAQPGANTEGKVRSLHATQFDSASTRLVHA